MASLLSAACMGIGFLVFTRSTLTPLDNMGVMTMKMISITSITSTMGVTLMSATGGGAVNFDALFFFRHRISPRNSAEAGEPLAGLPANQLAGS
jgi:hypothetical protein